MASARKALLVAAIRVTAGPAEPQTDAARLTGHHDGCIKNERRSAQARRRRLRAKRVARKSSASKKREIFPTIT